MLRADIHVHTHFSRDAIASPKAIVARCQKVGLNCIAVTDHNTIRGALEVQRLAPFTVIVGEEVKTTAGEVMGLFLREEVPRGMSPLETAKAIKSQGGLVVLPHPCDLMRAGIARYGPLDGLMPLVDAVEVFNAHTLRDRFNREARELARTHSLPVCLGSDAHAAVELGHTYMELPEFDGTPRGFLEALGQARLVARRARLVHRFITTYVKLFRRSPAR